mmetsp:Transcript_15883/g.36766  ORF Transcript_15883/g.36766 Transcript_15883/m.36766 type:complete len:273 (-) Transcript_15883:649-1467(-)
METAMFQIQSNDHRFWLCTRPDPGRPRRIDHRNDDGVDGIYQVWLLRSVQRRERRHHAAENKRRGRSKKPLPHQQRKLHRLGLERPLQRERQLQRERLPQDETGYVHARKPQLRGSRNRREGPPIYHARKEQGKQAAADATSDLEDDLDHLELRGGLWVAGRFLLDGTHHPVHDDGRRAGNLRRGCHQEATAIQEGWEGPQDGRPEKEVQERVPQTSISVARGHSRSALSHGGRTHQAGTTRPALDPQGPPDVYLDQQRPVLPERRRLRRRH